MKKIKKSITFIYNDSAEKSLYETIAKEAEKRGYTVEYTTNVFARCEIGVYCQHINFPQYSKLSIIMLHDITQQYANWPDLWLREPWNKYDIGILPNEQWEANWNKCSQWYYTRPRIGMYKIGWPKADSVTQIKKGLFRDAFNDKHGLNNTKKTILYAPAWENDGKEDDFVQAMSSLNVNSLIKQGPWNSPKWLKERPDIFANIRKMADLHVNMPGVTILNENMNIFEAIAASDILVSEESSTMCEATMMGIPAVSVSDWLIPDTYPSRYPECSYDFVTLTKKKDLRNTISEMLKNYDFYKSQTEAFAKSNFNNIGNTSSMIMDIIDDIVENKDIRYKALKSQNKSMVPIKQYLYHKSLGLKIALIENYGKQYPKLGIIINLIRKMKHAILRKT